MYDEEETETKVELFIDDQNGSEESCLICLDVFDGTAAVLILDKCKHSFHVDCLKEFLKEEANKRAFPIKCPHDECAEEIVDSDIRSIFGNNNEYRAQYNKTYVEYSIDKEPNKYIYCPAKDCKHVWCITRLPENRRLDCPICRESYCFRCRAKWHIETGCKKARKKIENEEENTFKKFIKDKRFKKCPNCGQTIERTEGCNAMKCLRCKTNFCYGCGRKRDGHNCQHKRW